MIGQSAENFTLYDEQGKRFDLYENLNKKVLLVFYPKDNSPVCTRQLNDYSKSIEDFSAEGIKIIGINKDTAYHHKSFCSKADIDFPLLVDEDGLVTKKFGARNFAGGTKRRLVLVGPDRRILFEKNVLPVFYLNTRKILDILKANNII